MSAKHLPARYAWLFVGVLINSFAIEFITKSALGTSPISSLPYVLSLAFPGLSFGATTFIMNTLFILIQVGLLRRDFQPVQILQLAVNVVFSGFIDVSAGLLSWFEPTALPEQLAGVVAGCALLALGISVELAPHVIVVPGEGVVRAIAAVTKRRFGSVKVLFDVTLVVLACLASVATMGSIEGLGLGTLISALLVGRFVNLCNRFITPLEKIRQLAKD